MNSKARFNITHDLIYLLLKLLNFNRVFNDTLDVIKMATDSKLVVLGEVLRIISE